MRAVFAAFMWHEGIVHDAMACASFLKFHPNLPKQVRKNKPSFKISMKNHVIYYIQFFSQKSLQSLAGTK